MERCEWELGRYSFHAGARLNFPISVGAGVGLGEA